jgi:transcriptional regulator with XRE-family HTH domain
MGPTTTRAVEQFAGSLLKLARLEKGLSQRELAAAAGMPHTTIAKIESGARQPSWPVLCRILAAADLEPRVRLEPYDNHDDVLDSLAARFPGTQKVMEQARDDMLSALKASR